MLVIGFIVVVVFNALWAINSEAFCSLSILIFYVWIGALE
ncbi:hypothetical protein HMPREF1431_00289 [Helicobacter pylori GAMchJs106B]|nr:hypothetical protein HMPREF1431_00289 [Helicobacter pylori GAMchJs106B]